MEAFSILKFLGGFNPFNGANWGKVLFVVVIVAVCIGVWMKIFEPKQTTVIEKIEKQVINQCEPDKSWVRLRFWKILNVSLGE